MFLRKFLQSAYGKLKYGAPAFISFKANTSGLKAIGKFSSIAPYSSIKGTVTIGEFSSVHEYTLIAGKVSIGNYTRIANNVSIHSGNHGIDGNELIHKQASTQYPITIGNDVWIGASAVVLPGIDISDGAVIGAGSVVTKSVRRGAIMVGNPAREIKNRFNS